MIEFEKIKNMDREYKIKMMCEYIITGYFVQLLDENCSVNECKYCHSSVNFLVKPENIQHKKDCIYMFALNELKNNYSEDFI